MMYHVYAGDKCLTSIESSERPHIVKGREPNALGEAKRDVLIDIAVEQLADTRMPQWIRDHAKRCLEMRAPHLLDGRAGYIA